MRKGLALIFIFSICVQFLFAQSQPYSFGKASLQQNIPVITMPKVDAVKLLKEDALNTNKEAPYRFGYKHAVSLDMSNAGLKQVLKDGSILWRVDILCPDAYSVNLVFNQFNIPDGAQLYLYSKDKSYIVGPYTSKNVTKFHQLGTGICKEEEIIMEYYEPFYAAFHGQLRISGITHAYKDPFHEAKSFGQSGSCDTNTICPVAAAWQNDKRSVALIIIDGNSFCSGAMLGNTTLDGTPYFLTAYHCFDTTFATWVFIFNYESPTCNPSADGPMNMTVNGAQLISLNPNSDFCLLELLSEPSPTYQVYYAGWNNANVPADSGVGIHHPMEDVKKISFSDSAAISSGWIANDGTHWEIDWHIGDTESGSSGSPFFDQNHHVVGQLHGGNSACGGNNMNDFYGKFAISWNGDSPSDRLKDWLDPLNSNAVTLNGYYPSQPADTLDADLIYINNPVNTICSGDSISPIIVVKNNGSNPITSMQIQYTIDGGTTITYNWTGTITTFETQNIRLPAFVSTLGSHIFHAYLINPNHHTDQDLSNNDLTSGFKIIDGANITIALMTDDFPNETSYILINGGGDTVLQENGFLNSDALYLNKICLTPGCYTFKIYDSGGDGICCAYGNGYYKIYNTVGDTLAMGGQFDSVDIKNFCAYSDGTLDLNDDYGINIYPNPTGGAVKLEWVKHFDRIDIQVVNSIGQQVRKESFYDSNNGSINLQHLAQGIYFFKINIGDQVLIRKVSLFETQ